MNLLQDSKSPSGQFPLFDKRDDLAVFARADNSSKPERREGSGGRRVSEQRGGPGGGYDRDRDRGTSSPVKGD